MPAAGFDDSVTLVWCAEESCSSTGPTTMSTQDESFPALSVVCSQHSALPGVARHLEVVSGFSATDSFHYRSVMTHSRHSTRASHRLALLVASFWPLQLTAQPWSRC